MSVLRLKRYDPGSAPTPASRVSPISAGAIHAYRSRSSSPDVTTRSPDLEPALTPGQERSTRVNRRNPMIVALAAGTVVASAMVAVAGQASAQPADPAAIAQLAADKADALVAARPAILQATANETFQKGAVISSSGLNYVPYKRTYKGLPVQGGDFVVSTDSAGNTVATSVAQSSPIGEIATTPKLTDTAALKIAKGELKTVSGVEATNLVVSA